jgi:cell wall-associated NlpC family hydrolase/peptidoglycan hydrolase-like protein with peptidoglycan-binding domain
MAIQSIDEIATLFQDAASQAQQIATPNTPTQSPYSLKEYAQTKGYTVDYDAGKQQYSIGGTPLSQNLLTGLQKQPTGSVYGTENQYANILNQYNLDAGSGQYTSPHADEMAQLYQQLENFVPYETPEETRQYLSNLLQSATQPFSYNSAQDASLQAAMQDVATQGLVGAAGKNTLYSGGTIANIARGQGALIPQFEQQAYSRFADERNREIQMASTIMQWDQMQYDRNQDQIQLIQTKFDYMLNLDALEFQKFQAMLEQRNFEKQLEIDRAALRLSEKQQAIDAAWARTDTIGYVDNAASIVLGLPAGTKAQWVRQAALEKNNQLDLLAKEYANQKALAQAQLKIDKDLAAYKNKLDEATQKRLAKTDYENQVKLLNKQQALATGKSSATFTSGVIGSAQSLMGLKYVWGGTSTTKGMDCSGFSQWVMKQNGVTLNRTAAQQAKQGKLVTTKTSDWSKLQKGDLLFWDTVAGNGKSVDHVGIYLGNGQMIHASSGSGKVITANINTSYWKNRFTTARRFDGTGGGGTASSGSSTYSTIRSGSSGSTVKLAQQKLRAAGYNIAADGSFGKNTKAAVIKFQKSKGLYADGVIGKDTWAALNGVRVSSSSSSSSGSSSSSTIRSGSSGGNVKLAQQKLKALGYNIATDGSFGKNTKAAVIKFQKAYGLYPDGVIGKDTWAKLNSKVSNSQAVRY